MSNKNALYMRVLYDISVLANGFVNYSSRTGIFRVVEEVSKKISNFSEVDLMFYVTKENRLNSKKYFEKATNFGSYTISRPKLIRGIPKTFYKPVIARNDHLTDMLDDLRTKLLKFEKHPLPLKVKTFIITTLLKLYNKILLDIPESNLSSIDVFHSTFYATSLDWAIQRKIPIIQNIYDLIPISNPEYFDTEIYTQWLNKIIKQLEKCGSFICISEFTKNDLLNYSKTISPERVFVTPLAASGSFYPCKSIKLIENTRKKFNIPEGTKYILSVATLEPRKNLITLVKSFKEITLSEKLSDLCLVLSGVLGWKYHQLMDEIKNDASIINKIILTGYVSDEDLSPLYTGALVFVYPSLYEGFGLPPLEAMQCGTPVITSNTTALPEVVGNSGIMINPLDVQEISQSILKLYYSDEIRKRMAKESIERATQFSWDKTAKKTIEAYKKTIDLK